MQYGVFLLNLMAISKKAVRQCISYIHV